MRRIHLLFLAISALHVVGCKKSNELDGLSLEGVSINGMPAEEWLEREERRAQEARDAAPLPPAPRTERTVQKYDRKLRGPVARPPSSPFAYVRSLRTGCGASEGGALIGCGLARVGSRVLLLAQTPVDAADWPQEKPIGAGRDGLIAALDEGGKFTWTVQLLGHVPHALTASHDGRGAYLVGRVTTAKGKIGDQALGLPGATGFFRARIDATGKVTETKTLAGDLGSMVADVDARGRAVFAGVDSTQDTMRLVVVGMAADGSQRFRTELASDSVPYVVDVVAMPNGGSAVGLWLPGGIPELVFLDSRGAVKRRGPTGQAPENRDSRLVMSSWKKGAAIAFPLPGSATTSRVLLFDENGAEVRRHDFVARGGVSIYTLNPSDEALVVGVSYVSALVVDGRELAREVDAKRVPFAFVLLDGDAPRVTPRYRGDNTYVGGIGAIRTSKGNIVALGSSIGPLVVDEEVAVEGLRPGEMEGGSGLGGHFLIATREPL